MNNRRLLTGLLSAVLLSGGVCSYGRTVMTLEEIFEAAEANSAQLRPYFAAEEEAKREISVARSERLPEINASLSLSYIGDGFTTKRNFSDYQRAPIPHLGAGLAVNLRQPLYTGGAIKNGIELAELKSTAALDPATVIEPDSAILARALPSDGESRWQQEAAENAPSLKLARSGVDLSRKAESLVRSRQLPTVGVQAAWTIDGPILVEVPPINRNLSYWYVEIGVSYDISSLYKTNKSLSKSRAATRQAMDRFEATRENVELDIRADYVRYLEAYEELKTRRKGVELAERNYRTTSTRYSADMALITDMLDAANSKLDAEQELVNARINIIYYYYKLLFTSGKI